MRVDKYELYEASVQEPEADVKFIRKTFRQLRGRDAITLREDFSGTSLISCEWVKLDARHQAFAVDLDGEPIEYSRKHHVPKLNAEQRTRLHFRRRDVMKLRRPRVDVVAAFNFSYWIFKKREELLTYFRSARRSLNADGVFILDLFGGTESQAETLESKRVRNPDCRVKSFTYQWECTDFDPIHNDIQFSIHFKLPGGRVMRHAFRYDWRLWTLSELRDLLREAGFSRSVVYWEGDDGKGAGNGVFSPRERAENSESWIAYVVALA